VTDLNNCYSDAQFDIVLNPLPAFTPPTPLEECDLGTGGYATFTLSDADQQITGGNTNLVVTYHIDQAAADAGTPQLPNSYTNTTPDLQTIYFRVEDTATGCYDTATLDLDAIPSPAATSPAPLEECDDNDGVVDGLADFDLSSLDAAITGGAGNVTVSYHATQNDADQGVSPLAYPVYNSPTATIYARVEENSTAGCHNTAPVDLVVLPNPDLNVTIPALEACDPEGDGVETFDLTQNEAIIKTNEPAPGDWTVEYYASAQDLNNGTPVADATAFTNDATQQTQAIHVLVTSADGCSSQTTFNVVVNPLPGVNTPETRIVCDDGSSNGIASFDLTQATTQITGNDPDLSVTYHEDAAGTGPAIGPNYTNTTPYNQTIYVRIEDNVTGCTVVLPMDLQVDQAPTANTPQPFVHCDPDNDGFGIFDLPTLDNEITGGAAGVGVTYHETHANALNDVLDIATPTAFANTVVDQQTIYARVEAPGVDCFVIVDVVLVVAPSPQPVLPQDLQDLNGCDEDGDGQASFDLTQMEDDIEANEADPSQFTLEYFASQADIPNNPIPAPAAFTSGSTTIYVVVTGPAPANCTKQTSFDIVVNPLPDITTPQPLELCDVNNPGDEKEEFDLTDATLDITKGDASIEITYYQTESDALAGTNAIDTSVPYTNQVNNETIYIRAVDTDTGCVVVQGYTLTLIVNPLPSPEIPADPLEVCDADNDGFAEFDLAAYIPIIQNNEADVVISFHYSQQDAENGVGDIDTAQPFGMTTGSSQTIWVRAENSITGCYVTGQLDLVGVPTPEIMGLDDLYVCDDDTPDGFATFDLTENTLVAIGTQDPTDLVVSYHISQQDAADGIDPIVVPSAYTNTVNPQTIYVRIENTETECIDTFDFAGDNSFELYVEELPVVLDPTPLAICDDDYGTDPTEQAIFDLTQKEGEITGQAFPPNDYEFTYYASQQDMQNGVAIADPTAYVNTGNPQTIYITAVNEDTQNLCEDYTTLTITVLPLPSPSETDQDVLRLEQCDDDNDGVAADPFDLTQSGNLIIGGENVVLEYYKTEAAAQTGDTASPEHIATPTAYVNEPAYNTVNAQGMEVQVIYVNVESNVAGNDCYVTAQFEIMVVPAPVLNPIDPFGYVLCEDGNTGDATVFQQDIAYNLYDTTGDPSVLVPLLDQATDQDLNLDNYDIVYSTDPSGTPPLPSGYVASTGDILYVYVVHEETGCESGIGEIEITVEPRPGITVINITERLCSDEPGGNTATIDLTQYDGQINPGAPANTEVVYYADNQAYMDGTPIEDPSAYTTTDNPQTIIGVVRDTNNLCESADHAEITVEVTPGPMVDISGYSGILCEDLDPDTQTVGGDYAAVTIETGLDPTQYSFAWTRNGNPLPENGPSLTVTQPGTYEVAVTDNVSGCTSVSTAEFDSGNPPEFEVDPLTMAFDGEHALLVSNVIGEGDYEFSVDDGPWMDLGSDGTLTVDGLSAGDHFVYGRDKNGCGTTVLAISFIDYPKFFTPNADGYNDTWNVTGLGPDNASAKVYIFDRYGKLLKQLSPSGPDWDGTYNGNPMPADDYWFRVEYWQKLPDGTFVPREFKANFSLIR
jgi:gliding motility-associated-like protein